MDFIFNKKRISGILVVVPQKERHFLEELKNFNSPEARSLKLKEVMGFDKRRIVDEGVCVSDLAIHGMQHLFDQGDLKREEIDALILVTQTPDHLMPATSSLIHGSLGLERKTLCLDINQACAGFVTGLMQAFMLLEQESVRKVVLINGDVLSRKASPKDRNIYPLIGDAVSVTVVERDTRDSMIQGTVLNDGSRAKALLIPAGGLRLPSSPSTAELQDVGDNNLRAQDHLIMDGAAIFNFVQTEVPSLIEGLLQRANRTIDSIDYLLCHQPNRFMLHKLADKMRVPHEKMPSDVVENFGNNGSASIPTLIAFHLGARALQEEWRVCMAGFGGGLTWGAMLLTLGKLDFNRLIDYAGGSENG